MDSKTEEKIKELLNKHAISQDYKALELDLREFIKNNKSDPNEIRTISPFIGQMAGRLAGMFCSTTLGNSNYYLYEFIHILISDLGEPYVEQEWNRFMGDDLIPGLRKKNFVSAYQKTKKNLDKYEKLALLSKLYYDALEDKKFEKKNLETNIKKQYQSVSSKIPALSQEMYNLFVFLIKKTQLQRNTIPSDAFKILEQSNYKTLDLSSRNRPMHSSPSEGGMGNN